MRSKLFLISFAAIFLLIFSIDSLAQIKNQKNDIRKKTIEELIKDFVSDDWLGKVVPAKAELESRQSEIIPEIIKLLDRNEKVKLKNTADLIYPGAETFYGHGWIMNYDVDLISTRAAWLLEDLTFQDFGFKGWKINEDLLIKSVIAGKRDVPLKEVVGDEQKIKEQNQVLAVKKAKDWWQTTGNNWKRFNAILEGLKDNDVALQHRIFQWLRNGDTKCDGLNIESFEKLLLPEVKRLSKSDNEDIQNEAKFLLESQLKEKWWYRYKLKRDYPETYTSMELK